MPQDIDIGWLAGIIDGEGCLTARMHYDKRDNRTRVGVRVNVSNSDVKVINKIRRVLDDLEVHYSVQERKPAKSSWKTVYHVDIQAYADVRKVLVHTINHLASNKKEIADAMLVYTQRRLSHGMGPLTDIDNIEVLHIRELCSKYNKHIVKGGE